MFPYQVQVSQPQGNVDLDIVGLMGIGNGCNIYKCCGAAVQVGDILQLVKTVVTVGNQSEEAVKLVRVIDCVDGCTVGFNPQC
jgi:hypothetical protein